MIRRALLLVSLTLLPGVALAQAQEGLYDVLGTDATLGAYAGEVQLRDQGSHFLYVRKVRFASPPGATRPVTVVWTGVAVRRGVDLEVTTPLNRMDWITRLPGGAQRTAADQAPDVVTGRYRPDPRGGLTGTLTSQTGAVSVTEVLTRRGPAGTTPLFEDLRTRAALHSQPPSWLRSILSGLFASYHQLPEVQPFVGRADFQSYIHYGVEDYTGFDWLRANPTELLLVNKRVDAISLREAELRRSAYGQRLFEKAAGFDQDARTRHTYAGLLAFSVTPNASGGLDKSADMSTGLWTACYMYGQSRRWLVTQDPVALAEVERLAHVYCDLVEIDPRPGEFARSLIPIAQATLGGNIHAGSGRFAHLAYRDNGNNDMIKGIWLAFLAAWEVLPQNSTARPRLLSCVREIADHWATSNPSAAGGTGHRRDKPKSTLVNNMLAFWMTGDPVYEQRYRAALRDPMLLLELGTGGSYAVYGLADWSGTHLGLCSYLAMLELGNKLNTPWQALFQHGLRMNYNWLHEYRGVLWSILAHKYLNLSGAADEARWQLREFPYPKQKDIEVDRTLDRTFSLDPIPSKPWKQDWTTQNRRSSLYTYPVFMRGPDNYVYRSGAFNKGGPGIATQEYHGGDYLFGYWLARWGGVVSATE